MAVPIQLYGRLAQRGGDGLSPRLEDFVDESFIEQCGRLLSSQIHNDRPKLRRKGLSRSVEFEIQTECD